MKIMESRTHSKKQGENGKAKCRKIKNLQNEKNIFNCYFISRFNFCM